MLNDVIASLPEAARLFVLRAKSEVEAAGFRFMTGRYGEISFGGTPCNGYFCDHLGELAFWVDPSNLTWLPIALHEYGHFLQWRDDRDLWMSLTRFDGETDTVDRWLSGERELSALEVETLLGNAAELEWDNEKKSVGLITSMGLGDHIDPLDYTLKANAYVIFYQIIKKYRSFYPMGKEPYAVPELVRAMPADFLYDPKNPPADAVRILDAYYRPLLGRP